MKDLILVTGSAGRIGRAAVQELKARGHTVRGFDLLANPAADDSIVGTLTDPVAVRLGWCPRTKEQVEEIAVTEWAQDVYLSPGDTGRFFACAVAPKVDYRFAVVYAFSKPVRRCLYDVGPARDLLGFEPQETWPQ